MKCRLHNQKLAVSQRVSARVKTLMDTLLVMEVGRTDDTKLTSEEARCLPVLKLHITIGPCGIKVLGNYLISTAAMAPDRHTVNKKHVAL
jgi:hypothetical protein